MRVKLLPKAILIATLLGIMQPALAATYTWTGATSNDFNTTTNWNLGVVPGASDVAIFPTGPSNQAVTITGTVNNVGSLVFNGPGYSITTTATGVLFMGGISGSSNATLTNNILSQMIWNNGSAASSSITNSNIMLFQGNSTAGNAIITNNPSATINFSGNSTAGNAVVTGSNSFINYASPVSSPNATFIMTGAGLTTFSTNTSIGSMSGDADIFLGSNTLTLGSLNLNDVITGAVNGGGGGITKIGSGNLTLSGGNTYTGLTSVLNGNLTLGNVLNYAATVNMGSTLNVAGYAPFVAGTPLNLEADPASTNNGLLNSSGAVTLTNSALTINFSAGIPTPAVHTLVQGTSVTGTFGSVTSIPAMLIPQLTYNPTSVTMTVQNLTISEALTVGLSEDQNSVINVLDGIFLDPGISADWQAAHGLFNTFDAVQLEQAVDALIPDESNHSKSAVNISTTNQINSAISNRSRGFVRYARGETSAKKSSNKMSFSRRDLPPIAMLASTNKHSFVDDILTSPWAQSEELKRMSAVSDMANSVGKGSLWVQPFGNAIRLVSTADQIGYNAKTGGVVVGLDKPITKDLMVGLSGGYGHSHLRFASNGGHSNISNAFMSLYTTVIEKDLHGDASVTGSLQEFKEGRNINFTGVSEVASNKHKGHSFNAHLGLGYDFIVNENTVEPFISGDYNYNRERGYTENGADIYNLIVRSRYTTQIQGEGGVRVSRVVKGLDMDITPLLSLSYVVAKPIKKSQMVSSFVGENGNIITVGTNRYRNYVSVGASSSFYTHASGNTLSFEYNGGFNERFMSNQVLMCYNMPL